LFVGAFKAKEINPSSAAMPCRVVHSSSNAEILPELHGQKLSKAKTKDDEHSRTK
jgi:hypothetical protein